MRSRKKQRKIGKRILFSFLAVLVVLVISGLIAVNYAVDKVIESMAASLQSNETGESSRPIPAVPTELPSQPAANEAHKEEDKPGQYAPQVSTKKAEAIKEKITIAEKADVSSILVGHLSVSDLQLLQELARGGMTVEEKRAARNLLLEKLTPEEYDRLVEIAQKYGVSQGKTYTEAEQEETKSLY
jgi:hypothetical protein